MKRLISLIVALAMLLSLASCAQTAKPAEGKGGNVVMKQHPEKIQPFAITNPYELMDVDTPETLRVLQKKPIC